MELFKLMGSILVDNDKANASISKTDQKAESLSNKFLSGIKTVGKWGAAIVAGASVVGGAMLGVANSSAQAMDEIDKMSAKIGISKKGYQEWKYVLGQNGMEIDKLQTGMKTLVSKMDSASQGTKSATQSFEKLGLSIYDSTGKLKNQETMMNEAIYALADMENGTEKARLATELFGKAGVEMMPMLNGGSEGMKDLTARAHELGLVVSDEAVDAGVVFGDTMDDLKQAFGMVGTQIGNYLVPVFQSMADWIIQHMPQIQQTIANVSNFIGSAVDFIRRIIQALAPIFQQVMSAIMNFWNTDGKPMFDAFVNMLTVLWGAFQNVLPIIQTLFNNFISTIGNLWERSLKPIFNGIIDFVTGVFSGDWSKAWNGIVSVFGGIFDGLVGIVSYPLNQLSSFVGGIVDTIKGFFNFKITFPSIPLPHFSISPRNWSIGDLLKGKLPSLGIEWYAKAMEDGMILDQPTIFGAANGKLLGAGEAGSETVVGTKSLMDMIQIAANSGNTEMLNVLKKICDYLSDEDRWYRIMLRALSDGSFSVMLDGREVGRIVRNYA